MTRVWPKNVKEFFVVLFVVTIIPYVYYFELFVVLPCFIQPWGFWYSAHFLVGTFFLFNICSNMVAVMLCDTSIKGHILNDIGPNSNFCSVCECITPPRAYHCEVCNICILKRDHHCIFTGCCIGHYNQRYFLMFAFYLFISTLYCSVYNVWFIFRYAEWYSLESILKLIFPLATLFVQYSTIQLYTFLVLIISISCMFTGALTHFHTDSIVRGVITFEKNKNIGAYDLGRWENVRTALGERWYLIWVAPFVESKLTHDGIHWNTKLSDKAK